MAFDEHGASDSCYGLYVTERRFKSLGKKKVDAAEAQVLAHSSYWPEQILDLIRYRATHKTSAAILVGGNSPTTNPSPYLAMGCYVWLGDGECYADDSASLLSPDNDLPRPIAVTPAVYPVDGYVDTQKEGKASRRSFVEISRGCKNRCSFCQYGWLKPYREAEYEHIAAVIERAETKHVRVFAADRFQHKDYMKIRTLLECQGSIDTGSDSSISFLLKHPEYLGMTRKIRTGIEGMSQRLRFSVNKKITDENILEVHELAVKQDIKCFDWYMIYGLPGETDEDAMCFIGLLKKLAPIMRGRTLAIHWNAFQPNACTPLQWASPAVRYDRRRLDTINTCRPGYTIMHKPLYTSPPKIAARVLLARSGAEHVNMLRSIAFKPSIANNVDLIEKEYRRISGFDLFGEWPKDKPFPWDKHVQYDAGLMWRNYEKNKKLCA